MQRLEQDQIKGPNKLFKSVCPRQDRNLTRYHVVVPEVLLKTDLQSGGYKRTLLGFPFQLGVYPRDGKVCTAFRLFHTFTPENVQSKTISGPETFVHGLGPLHERFHACVLYSPTKSEDFVLL